jgi:hypothetical protein
MGRGAMDRRAQPVPDVVDAQLCTVAIVAR